MPVEFQVRVVEIRVLTPLIKSFRLASADGTLLPGFTPGAHISVRIPENDNIAALWRSYSLVTLDPDSDPALPQPDYLIAVRRETDSRGGSRYLHDALGVGDTLIIREPVNDFPLEVDDDNVLLIAGGIGVTPIAAMVAGLIRRGVGFDLHYSCRSAEQMAFAAELETLAGANLHRHFDDDPVTALNIATLLDGGRRGRPIYVCGPRGMIDAVMADARARGWPEKQLHTELFTEAAPVAGDQPFDVRLARSGKTLTVRAEQSLLDALIEAGADPLYDCRNGYCGLCSIPVISGDIDHRDTYLLDADRAGGKVMQACVSRARSGVLVLDI